MDEEQKKFLAEIEEKVKAILKDAEKEGVQKEYVDKKVAELNTLVAKLSDDGMKELADRMDKVAKDNETLQKELADAKEALKAQSAELKKLTESGVPGKATEKLAANFREGVKQAILEQKEMLSKVNDTYGERLSMKEYFQKYGKRHTSPEMTIKVAVDMLESNVVNANIATVRLTELDPQRVGLPLTIYPHVVNVFPRKTISKPYMSILVVYDHQNGAGTKTEGVASTKSSFLFKTVEFKSFYIATYFTLSDETLDDLEEALDEINSIGPDAILDNIDSQVLGDDGDDTGALAGILTANKKTDWENPYSFIVDAPYVVDVIESAALQCKNNKYRPNAVYMSPTQESRLAAEKNTFEDSKSDKRVAYDSYGRPSYICGLRVLLSTAINENELVVLDTSKVMIGIRKDLTMEIGYNGTDLTEGQRTVVIKARLAFGVRDKAAVIYVSEIDDAIATLGVAS